MTFRRLPSGPSVVATFAILTYLIRPLCLASPLPQRFALPRIALLPYGPWTRPPHQWDGAANFQRWTPAYLSRCLESVLADDKDGGAPKLRVRGDAPGACEAGGLAALGLNLQVAIAAAEGKGCLLIDSWGAGGWGRGRTGGDADVEGEVRVGDDVLGKEGRARGRKRISCGTRELPQWHTVGIPVWCCVVNRCVLRAREQLRRAESTGRSSRADSGGGWDAQAVRQWWAGSEARELMTHYSVPVEVQERMAGLVVELEQRFADILALEWSNTAAVASSEAPPRTPVQGDLSSAHASSLREDGRMEGESGCEDTMRLDRLARELLKPLRPLWCVWRDGP